jgi:sensor histidine kinase YesM
MTPTAALAWIARTALWGAGGGIIVYLIIFGFILEGRGLIWCLSIGWAYALVMNGMQELAVRLLERGAPLRSRRGVLVRVAVLALVTLSSFLIATWLIERATGFELFGNTGTLVLSASIAFGASIIGNGYHHLELFHSRLVRAEQAALRAELQALRAQINPHFLFNSLNSIAALVRIDPVAAESVTESLADLFRYSLRAADQPSVTLAEEIESVELYLSIERARFPERLAIDIDVPAEIRSARVPSLLLQPLVENAIKHGVATTDERVTVRISGRLDHGDVVLGIVDDGSGFFSTEIEHLVQRGHGLANIRERLRLEYGDAASMAIAEDGVTLRFPLRKDVRASFGGADAALYPRR